MIQTPENGSVELLSTSSGNYVTEISMNIKEKMARGMATHPLRITKLHAWRLWLVHQASYTLGSDPRARAHWLDSEGSKLGEQQRSSKGHERHPFLA